MDEPAPHIDLHQIWDVAKNILDGLLLLLGEISQNEKGKNRTCHTVLYEFFQSFNYSVIYTFIHYLSIIGVVFS